MSFVNNSWFPVRLGRSFENSKCALEQEKRQDGEGMEAVSSCVTRLNGFVVLSWLE